MAENCRINKLTIKNFRSIGPAGVEIDVSKIVVLVGQNNSGKSSILKALKIILEGDQESQLKLDDFHNGKVENTPEIILETTISDEEKPGEEWIITDPNGRKYVKERWIWKEQLTKPDRSGWLLKENRWSDKSLGEEQGPWGPDNVALSKRPEPHEVNPFDQPETQASKVAKLIGSMIQEKITGLISDETQESKKKYEEAVTTLTTLRKVFVDEARPEIKKLQDKLNEVISNVFMGEVINYDPKSEDDVKEKVKDILINPSARLIMGPEKGYKSSVEKQGSGAQRTVLWAALKVIAELGVKKSTKKSRKKSDSEESLSEEKSRLLLMNEPEICLHPSAIREAREILYGLPDHGKWQIMISTHSPIFIDLAKDTTTIIRIEKDESGNVTSENLFRPEVAKLSDTDKINLKMQNIVDPYFCEFFFSKYVIIVEGDTEYSAFRFILNEERNNDVQIVRARGKAIIPSIVKILNHFGKGYSVLHDSDKPLTEKGSSNPMWSINESILKEFKKGRGTTKLVASIFNFELASTGREVEKDKPWSIVHAMQSDEALKIKVTELLHFLTGDVKKIPDKFVEWSEIEALEAIVLSS